MNTFTAKYVLGIRMISRSRSLNYFILERTMKPLIYNSKFIILN